MPPSKTADRDIFSVSRLNLAVRDCLEHNFGILWVEGELSNLARPTSGHLYFSLKDAACQVRCAMFRGKNRHLGFAPDNGVQVLVRARVSLYPDRGDFQLVVEYMEEAGAGALRRAFEDLKQRLSAEGLFAAERKRPLPKVPRAIGVITSPSGAAVQDILSVLKRRYPAAPVFLYAVPVQGAAAAPEIARMLGLAGDHGQCDVLILARGGGSLEDLWAFNDEAVARAVAECPVPVVTGIGHETDFSIADFAADLRAPTPSVAAENVSPDRAEWRQRIAGLLRRALLTSQGGIQGRRHRLDSLSKRVIHPRRRLEHLGQRTDELLLRMNLAMSHALNGQHARVREGQARLAGLNPMGQLRSERERVRQWRTRLVTAANTEVQNRRQRLQGLLRALEGVAPQRTLERGYAIVTDKSTGQVVRHASDTQAGQVLTAKLAEGEIDCTVETIRES
ncbi:MAG: exodeoxyribonuclease VII large subunit [Gammaproteobacteria bacterium]|nr:MAG: exodeoxyribonuclease VII large subunit [Gammaproteobacteria bacterium]